MSRPLLLLLLFSLAAVLRTSGQQFDVDTLQYSGATSQHINLVILGDGYTAEQLLKFSDDARNFSSYFLNHPPYDGYRSYFNVFAIRVPSPESGIKHPQTTTECKSGNYPVVNPDNYFGTTFDAGGIHRLVVPSYGNKIALVLAEHLPDYDQVVLLANSRDYGGSGGTYATATLAVDSNEIAVHEIGHSFASLADEYWVGTGYAAERPNMTQENNPQLIKWKNWLTPGTRIGIFQHTGYPWYKPGNHTCKMEFLNQPYCAVCAEAIIGRIHTLVKPVAAFLPDNASPIYVSPQSPQFYVSLQQIAPRPPTLQAKWQLNAMALPGGDSVQIDPRTLQEGDNKLSVTLVDTTSLSRNETGPAKNLLTINWTINQSALLPVTLTAFAATAHKGQVKLSWSTAAEVNSDRFELERSTNGLNWLLVGTVRGHGNSLHPHQYTFYDHPQTAGSRLTLYYRLKLVDRDNSHGYSAVEVVSLVPAALQVRLLGNPVGDHLHFEASTPLPTPVTLRVYLPDGSRIVELPVTIDEQALEIKIPVAQLLPGLYIYTLHHQTQVLDTGRFLKLN